MHVLSGLQADLAARAAHTNLLRRIPAAYKQFAAAAKASGAYGVKRKDYWNPDNLAYNAWEWYSPEKPGEHQLRWDFGHRDAGPHILILCGWTFGRELKMHLLQDGKPAATAPIALSRQGIHAIAMTLPAPGNCSVVISAPADRGSACCLARTAYLVPKEKAWLLPPQLKPWPAK